MKKAVWPVGSVVVALIISIVLLQGCSSLRQISGSKFLELAEEIHETHSAKNTQFIGVAGQRVYLEHWSAPLLFGSGMTVYWTRLSDLPEELSSDMEAGGNPWKEPSTRDTKPMQADGPSGRR